MARGWESKSVEAQLEAAEEKPAAHHAMTPEEMVKHREREALLLSRARVIQQLETARDPRYIKLLNESLEALNRRLAESK